MMRQNPLLNITPIVKNLLIINALMLFATYALERSGIIDLSQLLGLHYFKSPLFKPFQFVTHLFMHGDFMHLFFNMFSLFMFGQMLERVWGPKRFFAYYLATGFGAAVLHLLVQWYMLGNYQAQADIFFNNPTPELFKALTDKYIGNPKAFADFIANWQLQPSNLSAITESKTFINDWLSSAVNVTTVGASGAIFGLLLAFGMIFPNVPLMLLFFPIPIKAKYFVMIFGAIELYSGLSNSPGDNIAHFAHLGGMVFGFILIKSWGTKKLH